MALFDDRTRNDIAIADPRWRSKSILHLVSAVFSFIAVTLFATAIPLWENSFFHSSGPIRGDWTDGLIIAPLLISFIYSCASLISTFVQRKRLPPILSIAMFMGTLVFLLAAIVLAGVGSVFPYWRPNITPNSDGMVLCNALNMFTRECEPVMYQIGELQIAGLIFSILVWLSTTLLIIIAFQEWRDLKYLKRHQLRKLHLYSDPEKGSGRTAQRIKIRNSITRMSYLRPPSKTRFSRYSMQNKDSTSSGTTVPFVFIQEPEPSHQPEVRQI